MPAPFIFNSPGDVALACFDEVPEGGDPKVVLPTRCCATESGGLAGCPNSPERSLSHALVTQTARGEVAAVDLDNSVVLDSERRVPGYTFVDVGGLPAAIVVPSTFPGCDALGPPWTYVAGREVSSIRAIATCRFRLGEACGPEIDLAERGVSAAVQTEIPLPEAPEDMLLDPSGTALWVSLPKAGLLARIDLGLPADGCVGDPSGGPPSLKPFAHDADTLVPRAPAYFKVPSGIALPRPEREPDADADAEVEEYRSVCGTEYEVAPSTQAMPLSTWAESTRRAQPTRLRLLPPELPSDPALAEPGSFAPLPTLFVADPGQAVVHVFDLVDGTLEQRGALPVGAPLRDFVLTAPVPSTAPDFDSLVDPNAFAYTEPIPDDRRYMFGIDNRDGTVMAFELSLSGGRPTLTPLDAPMPQRREIDPNRNVRDRLMFEGAFARTLEIVDTRYRDMAEWALSHEAYRANRDPLYCGAKTEAEIDALISEAKGRSAPEDEIKALEALRDWNDRGARADVLRGVFLVVASGAGQLSVIDIHDLNLQCRARAGCTPGDSVPHGEESRAPSLALRRHARRVLTAKPAEPLVGSRDRLMSFEPEGEADAACPDGYYQPDEDYLVCVSRDPWQSRNLTWTVLYEGPIASMSAALLEREEGADRVTLWGPEGSDLCARGANAADGLAVAIVSPPDPDVESCARDARGSEKLLDVVEAYRDHLVLVPSKPLFSGEDRSADLDTIMRCHPSFVEAEIRLRDQYRVTYTDGPYLHRNRADDAGVCEVNEDLDPRITSRASAPDWVFQDSSVAFRLQVPDLQGKENERDEVAPTVQLTQQSSFLWTLNVDSASGRADALPSRMRFFPGTDSLFVVDGASQGLRRYELEPFQHDGSRFR